MTFSHAPFSLAVLLGLGLATATVTSPAEAAQPVTPSEDRGAVLQIAGEAKTEWQRTFRMRQLPGGGGAVDLDAEPMTGSATPPRTDGPQTEWQERFGQRHGADGVQRFDEEPVQGAAEPLPRPDRAAQTEWQRVFEMQQLPGGGGAVHIE
jgi:hypothetical protein